MFIFQNITLNFHLLGIDLNFSFWLNAENNNHVILPRLQWKKLTVDDEENTLRRSFGTERQGVSHTWVGSTRFSSFLF